MLSSSPSKIHEPLITGVLPPPTAPRPALANCETRDGPAGSNAVIRCHVTVLGTHGRARMDSPMGARGVRQKLAERYATAYDQPASLY